MKKKENAEILVSDSVEINRIKKNLGNKKIKTNILGRNQNQLKTTFYSERFFGKADYPPQIKTETEKKEEKLKNMNKFKNNLSHLHLPFLNDNIIFQRGETEKLLNLNFYKTSYRACCEINKQIDMPNSCIRKNYKNNWKLVKQYAKDIKNIQIDTSRKKSESYNFFRKKNKIKITSPSNK